ncbi:helix-turn-helix domain-containing protein [Parapedobacter sp. DT-150]|uniref:helix-turn-helix domain-containing protein n=1 Tax=Parapedobacter sp. DT-150 TaxID=3396162 RepID=UPI003F1D558B
MAKKVQEAKKVSKQVNEDLIKLGKRIKELRTKAGYSNYEYFAYEHEIPRAQYGRYERGEDLRYTSLLKVIKALGVTVEEFFSEGFD